jgi:pimeloyl-ACP methyl ester carboxylesterase
MTVRYNTPARLPRRLSRQMISIPIANHTSRQAAWFRVLIPVLWLVVCGCATTQFVELREKPRNPLTERLKTGRLGIAAATEKTAARVIATGYEGPNRVGPMLKYLRNNRTGRVDQSSAAAQAELNYLAAKANYSCDQKLASELFLDAAEAAWSYFSTEDSLGYVPDPASDDHRAVAEIYNASVEALLRIAQQRSGYRLGRSLRMPMTQRRLLFDVPFSSALVNRETLGEYKFVTDYEIKNLRNRHGTHGLGVPIIAVRNKSAVPQPVEEFYTDGMSFAATVVLRFPDANASRSGNDTVLLQVFDPRESDGLHVNGFTLPLETDLSTPLAEYLSNPGLTLLDTWGVVRADRVSEVSGLYMVQPYDPNRIPVLMVHGLWSSPMTWMEMFNDLQADPDIRRKYQFWFYLYPSGEPLAVSAADLRDELDKVRDSCDPHRRNPKIDQMVVVGHSMGGLISHLLTIDSDDKLWNSVSQLPLDQIPATPKERNDIRRVFFFHSNPSINRIVTIASPYAGSRYSNSFTQWLGSQFIWLPNNTTQLHSVLAGLNGKRRKKHRLTPRTSVDSLRKQSAILKLVRSTSVPDDVQHHNIVGVVQGETADDWSDGVVSWQSSHRDDANSEIVVKAKHSDLHRHPEAIEEVRRILLDHLNQLNRRRYPVVPVGTHRTATQPSGTQQSATQRAETPRISFQQFVAPWQNTAADHAERVST